MAPRTRHSGNPARAERSSALAPHEAAVDASLVALALDRTPHHDEAARAHRRAQFAWSLIARITSAPGVRAAARASVEAHADAAEEAIVRAALVEAGLLASETEVAS